MFFDPRSLDPEVRASLHAKAVVVDERRTFVTSANFTDAALDRNIELGLVVDERFLAVGIVEHLQS